MSEIIQLLTVENTTNRKRNPTRQKLAFLIRAANLGYEKQVDVIWSGKDDVWRTLSAQYIASSGGGQEYWRAETTLEKTGRLLPGNIEFALRLNYKGKEYWDKLLGNNYTCRVNSGIQLAQNSILQNLSFVDVLEDGQQWISLKIAVNPQFAAKHVAVHWTIDDWQHIRQSACHLLKPLPPPSAQIWFVRFKIGDAFRLQYSIKCKNQTQEIWDNNRGANYAASHAPLKVLILNLHCYQEDDQDRKFSQIAKAINEQAVDVVCFQEVAEHWNHGHGDWDSNSANIIRQRVDKCFHLYFDWSHLGFDKYREGVAILSRYAFSNQQSNYVSDSHDIYSIHSRKVVMAQIDTLYFGAINIFSAHLSWWEDGFQQQFRRLCEWADGLCGNMDKTAMLCGDFNITAGSAGYKLVVNTRHYEDQFLAANAQGLFDKIYRVNDPHWQSYPSDDYRIDYIFMNKDSKLKVTSARVLFTEQDYGRVSDHCGYLMSFEPK